MDYHGSVTLVRPLRMGPYPADGIGGNLEKELRRRILTYVILGEHGSRYCVPNGVAARTRQPAGPDIIWHRSELRPHDGKAAQKRRRHASNPHQASTTGRRLRTRKCR
ncbi:aspartate 1-decarboxylase [Mesorhizobium sp.]|uniref:aspartate 1-decarboxylase n=1 Tax=Mesorhizobium sp. TaxID=1871066 RepID=UPI000FE545C8|nr:aspartate 1-decarboxylase [Mesorhizobium sp.]RWO53507.1 MAG: hypothetical protein EOS14_33140 [Mesorhizobium sp.]TIL48501.1 MAG: hypothetical protein E5Y83_30880 [Mesorhizobium sp.]